jgi:hypothetical protein
VSTSTFGRHEQDEVGTFGAAHLMRTWMLDRHDAAIHEELPRIGEHQNLMVMHNAPSARIERYWLR